MPRRPHTILVVDDELAVVESVQDLLRHDYRVLGATSAADGIALMHSDEVHVVMTDQRMPGMSGVEFLSQIRGAHPDAIRLIFTGYADIRAVIDAINHGSVYRYITKPWDPEELEGIIRDAAERYDLIVERKQLLADVTRANHQLERKNRELAEASAMKTAFIRVASHELRTPMMVLSGLSELALRERVPDPVNGYLKRIDAAAARLGRHIYQITSMLAAGDFRRALERKPTEVAALITDAVDDVRPFLAMRNQEIGVEVAPDVGSFPLDAVKMRDCLDHLLFNAIKFTPDGKRIQVAVQRPDGVLEISVRDEGVGIADDILPLVFEPFFTGFDSLHHSSGTYEFGKKGMGLGLAVVRAWVEMHGGRISAHSQRGEGATFTVTLPADG
jgi:signal transduction histidine kinase